MMAAFIFRNLYNRRSIVCLHIYVRWSDKNTTSYNAIHEEISYSRRLIDVPSAFRLFVFLIIEMHYECQHRT